MTILVDDPIWEAHGRRSGFLREASTEIITTFPVNIFCRRLNSAPQK